MDTLYRISIVLPRVKLRHQRVEDVDTLEDAYRWIATHGSKGVSYAISKLTVETVAKDVTRKSAKELQKEGQS